MTSCRSDTLAEWLTKHRGAVVQIGTDRGSGFLYAGKAGMFTLDAIRSAYREEFGAARVIDVYPSLYAGYVVIVTGTLSGRAELPPELLPRFKEPPIENYKRFADSLAAEITKEYKAALISVALGAPAKDADRSIITAEKFFRSDLFAVICPNTDAAGFIRLIKRQVKKEVNEREERRRKQAERHGIY